MYSLYLYHLEEKVRSYLFSFFFIEMLAKYMRGRKIRKFFDYRFFFVSNFGNATFLWIHTWMLFKKFYSCTTDCVKEMKIWALESKICFQNSFQSSFFLPQKSKGVPAQNPKEVVRKRGVLVLRFQIWQAKIKVLKLKGGSFEPGGGVYN